MAGVATGAAHVARVRLSVRSYLRGHWSQLTSIHTLVVISDASWNEVLGPVIEMVKAGELFGTRHPVGLVENLMFSTSKPPNHILTVTVEDIEAQRRAVAD
jgi:hypothetical protein